MGSSGSRREELQFLTSNQPSAPLASDLDGVGEEEVCAVCLCDLARAPTFALPGCGHRFHSLCIAASLQPVSLCPMCRGEVEDAACNDLARHILASSDCMASSTLAVEIIMELNGRGRTQKSEITEQATIDALHHAAKQGDSSKVGSIAALIGSGTPAVREAAVQALKALVPAFSSMWPGLQAVISALCGCAKADTSVAVRIEALRALQEIGQRRKDAQENQKSLLTARELVEDRSCNPDVRLQAAELILAVGQREDPCSIAGALAAVADPDSAVRAVGLRSLKQTVTKSNFDELLGLLRSSEPEVRIFALQLLGQVEEVGGRAGMEVASAAIEDNDEEVSAAAMVLLCKLAPKGDSDSVNLMARLAGSLHKHPRTSVAALEALSRIAAKGDPVAVEVSLSEVANPDLLMRNAAIRSSKLLAVRGDASVEARLASMLSRKDEEVRREVVQLIGALGTRSGQAGLALKAMQENCIAAGDDELVNLIERSLLQMHH